MSLVINHNMMAANVARNLNTHYGKLAQSTQRLSTGLRVNSAADDAAGLAIRELQRADIAAYHQGARNANDAISMIQTADGALAIIDEKLIRMKELAEQAATGTYDSTQRLMIDSEFQAMAAEIDRIANATDFNGIHLLNGNLSGKHDGSGLNSTGAMKIHFGSGNDSAEDYYYVNIGRADILGLGLGGPVSVNTVIPSDSSESDFYVENTDVTASVNSIINDKLDVDEILFSGDKRAIGTFYNGQAAGLGPYMNKGLILSTGIAKNAMNTPYGKQRGELGTGGDLDLQSIVSGELHDASSVNIKFSSDSGMIYFNVVFASEEYPQWKDSEFNDVCGIFLDGQNYTLLDNIISIDGVNVSSGSLSGPLSIKNIFNNSSLFVDNQSSSNSFAADGYSHTFRFGIPVTANEQHTLKIAISDRGDADYDSWFLVNGLSSDEKIEEQSTNNIVKVEPIHIDTQEKAQYALERIDNAIVIKDKIRAHLGALQNRLENTITNITTQAENLQAAESRISDVDVATEMTEFVRQQILAQSAVAMLSQANSMPQMAMQLIGG